MNSIEEQATGCIGANGYRKYARDRGFTHIEVLDWTSSAGDWFFAVSKDGIIWFILAQENNYPRPGFSYYLGNDKYYGTFEQVAKEIYTESTLY